jgi:anti-sigma-K factor RskA
MNLNELQKKLTAAARQQPPDDRVPYAFEKRIMALIAERTESARQMFWARGLWRAAVTCVALAVVCGAVSLFAPDVADSSNDLSQDLENTLLASADPGETPLP